MIGRCYECGQIGHRRHECPRLRNQNPQVRRFDNPPARGGNDQRPRVQARTYAITREEAQNTPNVIKGIISVSSGKARVPIDSGSKHSFVSPNYVPYLSVASEPLGCILVVRTPSGILTARE